MRGGKIVRKKTNEKNTKGARNENKNPDRNYQAPALQYHKMDFGDKPNGKTIKKAIQLLILEEGA